MTHQRITNCYDLMDSAYDSELISKHSESLGHVPIINENPRSRKAEVKKEGSSAESVGKIWFWKIAK